MSELVPTPSVKIALFQEKASAQSVFRAATEPPAPVVRPSTPLPQNPELNASSAVLLDLSSQLANLELPDTHRQLSPAEQKAVVDALAALKPVVKALTASESQIKAALFNHFDDEAAKKGLIDEETPRTKEGWAVLEGEVASGAHRAVRQVSNGSISLPLSGLEELEERGEISHGEFLAMTTQTRVVDEDKVLSWMRKNPGRVSSLASATTRQGDKASLYLRGPK